MLCPMSTDDVGSDVAFYSLFGCDEVCTRRAVSNYKLILQGVECKDDSQDSLTVSPETTATDQNSHFDFPIRFPRRALIDVL